ncbi:MAG TPA: phosphoribosylformimino-5-aminoimidazole carboxamide ribotide isomerase [Candidatus Scybalocola faecavium]|nr:phosphoribosylformimino-5-aminoimidazole carboxamide ribotide isomerase [Candidatus Scybalocola faecavium]
MKFRPCIDIHNGRVKQIVGGSLSDKNDQARENFVSVKDAAWYADLYRQQGLTGGHMILLNPSSSPYYEADIDQARQALKAYPGGLQIGGGMNEDNASGFLDWGASHVIVTSYCFKDGQIHMDRLKSLSRKIGKEHLVLDLSCRKKPDLPRDDRYYIVTDRWQKFTQVPICEETFAMLEPYCDEFLIHAVDVEGKSSGIEKELIQRLCTLTTLPIAYAGGIHSMEDIDSIRTLSQGRMDFTVGSALDLFGGTLPFDALCRLKA